MDKQRDTLRDAGKFERPPHQASHPDPLPEREQLQVEKEEREAARDPEPVPEKC